MRTSAADAEELADLLRRLGDIPESRVLRHPPPGQATEADALALAEAVDKRLCELVDGTLVEKPVGQPESRLTVYLSSLLLQFVLEHDLGDVTGQDTVIRFLPGSICMPDIAFTSWERLPAGPVPQEPIAQQVPELVVEVLSPSNTPAEMRRKRNLYFSAGVDLVWEVELRREVVTVFRDPDTSLVLTRADVLTGDPVLPGLRIALDDLFAAMERRRPYPSGEEGT